MTGLPITSILQELRKTLLKHDKVMVAAPPGSGKTTGIPPALLDEPWLACRRILMLEPRRLAARLAAARMAYLLSEPTGRTVGYRIRFESRVSPETRIEVLTEGILTRRLQNDPLLEDTGLIIFDEFHERSLQADLALTLCLDAKQGLRDDLRILIMSATLDLEAVAGRLPGAVVVRGSGREYPVSIRYLPDTGPAGGRFPAGPPYSLPVPVRPWQRLSRGWPGRNPVTFWPFCRVREKSGRWKTC